jgi:hypothetical protein
MASSINPNDIDGSYPVAGQDNNSQGFRDNFTNIKTNFTSAANEITDLQNKAILKAALTGTTLDNNMSGALIYDALIQDFAAQKVTISTTSGAIAINYASGHYQSITTSGSISLSFTNWPTNGTYGYVKLQINISNAAHTVTLPAAVTLGVAGIQGISPTPPAAGPYTISFTAGTYELAFGTYNGGTTVTIFDLNRGLTNFSGADITLDDITATGNIIAGSGGTKFISATGNVVAGGNVVATGNVVGANLTTAGLISATGNITGGNITSVAGQISTGGNVTGGNVAGFIRPTTGTAAQAPVRLTSGTNTSTAAAGSVEYDGVVFYGTATASNRGVLPAEQFIALVSDYVANNSASAQKVFNSPTNGAITLDGGTTYMMEGVYYITRGLGSTSHTLGTLFALGGSLTSITYTADTTSTATYALGAVSRFYNTTASLLTVTAASVSTTENITVVIKGMVRTNSAGTFTPQIQYSSAPGGAPTILKNSYFRMTPVGNSTVASVGNWS